MQFCLQILLCLFPLFLEATSYLMDAGTNQFSHACLSPATCQGCGYFVEHNSFSITSAYRIYCYKTGITTFPIFSSLKLPYTVIAINFAGNHITEVPANAFHNIQLINLAEISVGLSSNFISTIDVNAFNDISDYITTLDVANNNLNSIPVAISTLRHLQYLYLTGNPISHVDSTVFSSVGKSLNSLALEFAYLSTWPTAFNSLYALTTLRLYEITTELNDSSSFDGFANSLRNLRLEYSVRDYGPNFQIIPPAVKHLKALRFFTVEGEVYCTCNLSYLKNWQIPSSFQSTNQVYLLCHRSNDRVSDYITNIGSRCH